VLLHRARPLFSVTTVRSWLRSRRGRLVGGFCGVLTALAVFAAPAVAQETPGAGGTQVDPEKGTRDGTPLDDLPPHIRLLSDTGLRPDWSPNGKQLVVLEGAPLGQAAIIDVATGKKRVVTEHFEHRGISRAYFLHNGDLLLCGPTSGPEPSPEKPEAGRFTGVMSVLRKPFRRAPQSLGMPCWEGMATSRRSMRIAWNRSDIDYTDDDLAARVVNGVSEIWTGVVRYREGRASLADVERAVERNAVSAIAVLEVQGFKGSDERELLLTAYAHQGGEVIGVDLDDDTVTNYSNSPVYEEVEGVAGDGSYALVERDLESTATPGPLDIWRLALDGSGSFERLTFFNRYRGGYYASNPTVSPDGKTIAFQQSFDRPVEGAGQGILLFDLKAFEKSNGSE
jgi:WD40-like Beta Propeller Repeat